MLHYDYTWDLYPNYMVLDPELKVENLGWKEGDEIVWTKTSDGSFKLTKK